MSTPAKWRAGWVTNSKAPLDRAEAPCQTFQEGVDRDNCEREVVVVNNDDE